jgi:hypothetical protein
MEKARQHAKQDAQVRFERAKAIADEERKTQEAMQHMVDAAADKMGVPREKVTAIICRRGRRK